jgi:hypothetical protein
MAIVTMTDAIAGTVALASEYNKVTANVRDLDTRVQFLELAAGGGVIGGEYQANALQALITGATKLTLPTANIAASGITYNGTNQFTVVTAGVYSMYASCYVASAANNFEVFIGNASATLTSGVYGHGAFNAGGISNGCSCVRYLGVGATICAYVYLNSTGINTAYSTYPAQISVWRVS